MIWTGANDGPFHVTRDNGKTWTNVTPKDLPTGGRVQWIDASPHRRGSAYFAVYRYLLGDYAPYIYRTDDYGKTWTRLTDGKNGIPADTPTRVVREDPDRAGLLYAGTEFGMYISFDNGAHWQPFNLNVPQVPITDIEVHRKDLVVSTQGRAFWILDNLTPLHQITPQVTTTAGHLQAARRLSHARRREAARPDSRLLPAARRRRSGDGGDPRPGRDGGEQLQQRRAGRRRRARTRRTWRPGRRTAAAAAAGQRPPDDDEHGAAGPRVGRWRTRPRRPAAARDEGRRPQPLRLGRAPSVGLRGRPAPTRCGDGGDWTATQPFNVLIDPRLAAEGLTVADLKEQSDHNLRVRELGAAAAQLLGARARAGSTDANGGAGARDLREAREHARRGPLQQARPAGAHPVPGGMTAGVDQKIGRDAIERYQVLKKELDALKAEVDRLLGPEN